MLGITRGIGYLHDNNIIHWDIKPGNILIDNNSFPEPKLTDFDLSKYLNPDVETSVMSSSVGTNAFKAPEFFNRIDGKLRYHRNVDIYAAGLTFLAMIQAPDHCRNLKPQMETPQDDPELYVQSIGQLIAERIKNKIPELNIVAITEGTSVTFEGDKLSLNIDTKMEIRKLIQKRTCVKPTDRMTANSVEWSLKQV